MSYRSTPDYGVPLWLKRTVASFFLIVLIAVCLWAANPL